MKRRMVSGERNAINMAFRVAFKILFLLFTIHYSLLTRLAFGQTLVQVSDTLYNADGTKASGRMIISWDPFTTADDTTIDGGTFSYTIPASGVDAGKVDVSLAPNVGATPAGTSYRVRYYLANGASYTESWVVPASGPATIAQVRTLTTPIPIPTVNASQITGVLPTPHGGTGLDSLGSANQCLKVNSGGTALEYGSCAAGGGHTIQEEGSSLAQRTKLNFVGGAITATDDADNDQTDVTVAVNDSTVPNDLTLDNITQITNRAIGDTSGDLAASRVDDGGAAATQALFSGAGAAAGFRAIGDGDIPASIARDSEINVQGTANEIASSGSGPAPALSLAAQLNLSGKEILGGGTPLKFEGASDDNTYTAVAVTDPTAARTFTIPNADSVAVQPQSCSGTDKVAAVSAAGVITCSADQTGAGGGDAIRVEDGDNAGTFTAMSDADFDDSGDINFARTAGPPDIVTATIRAGAVSADELDEAGVESSLEAVLDLADLQGDLALGSKTSGDYVSTLSTSRGLTGSGTGETSTPTVAIDWAQTLAGNPALNLGETIFSDDCTSGGFLTEGSTANTNEQLHCFVASDGADTTSEITENGATQTLTNKTIAAADNAVEADDLICTNCIGPTEISDLTLGTDTAGNFIQSLSSGTGLTGFPAAAEQATGTPALDFSQTLAGNPAFNAEECVFSTDGTGGGGFLCEGSTGGNSNEQLHLFAAADGADTTDFIATASAAVTDAIGAATTSTLTGKTLNVESSGNDVTTVSYVKLGAAMCVAATAFINWNDDASGGTEPTPACNDTGAIQRPSADFSGSAQNNFDSEEIPLPTGFAGNVDITIRYVSVAASPTGNVEWEVSTVCRAIGESWDGAYNAAQTITDAVGSQNQANDATQTNITMTGCAAGEDLMIRVGRDGTNDTNNDLAKMLYALVTLRRTQ